MNDIKTILTDYDRELSRRGFSVRSIPDYVRIAHTFLEWWKSPLVFLDKKVLADFRVYLAKEYVSSRGKSVSTATQRRMLMQIQRLCKFLFHHHLISHDPSIGLELPAGLERNDPIPLSTGIVLRLLDLPARLPTQIRTQAVLYFLCATGARASECAGLAMQDIDLERREAKVLGKGGNMRLVFFTHKCASCLRYYLTEARPALEKEEKERFFLTNRGYGLTQQAIWNMVREAMARLGEQEHVHPHRLRKWLCTTLLERGANIRVVNEIAGHARLSTTAKYAAVTGELLQRVYGECHPRSHLA